MVFFWTGCGYLAFFLGLALFVGIQVIAYYGIGQEFYKAHEAESGLVSGLIAGAVVFVLGARLNKRIEGEEAWRQITYRMYGSDLKVWHCAKHTLYWLPMQYWGILWALAGIGFFTLSWVDRLSRK